MDTELQDAIKIIFRSINRGQDVSRAVLIHLETEHRTLEQGFFRAIKDICERYKDFPYDARNESAVRFAAKVADIEEYMPLI